MNEKMIALSITKTNALIEQLNLNSGKTKEQAFFSEKQLEKYTHDDNPYQKTWVFFCRAHRFILFSVEATDQALEDNLQETADLLKEYLNNLHRMPDDVKSLISNNRSSRRIIHNVLALFPLDETRIILSDIPWLMNFDEFKVLYYPDERTESDGLSLSPLGRINYTRLNDQIKSKHSHIRVLISQDLAEEALDERSVSSILNTIESSILSTIEISMISEEGLNIAPSNLSLCLITAFVHKNYSLIKKNSLYQSSVKDFILYCAISSLMKGLCRSSEECQRVLQLYDEIPLSLAQVNFLYQNRYAIVREIIDYSLYRKAYETYNGILARMYGHLNYYPKNEVNFLALLCKISAVDAFIQTRYSGQPIFNPLEKTFFKQADLNNTPSEIKPLLQEAAFRLLLQIAKDTQTMASPQEKQPLIDIYQGLECILLPYQVKTLNKLFKKDEFCAQLSLSLFGKKEQKNKSVNSSSNQALIQLPESLIAFCNRINQTKPLKWYLCGAAVFELDQNLKPNDYDMLVIGIDIDGLMSLLDEQNISYQRQGKHHPILMLSPSQGIDLEIKCLENKKQQSLETILSEDFAKRDFKPCALYAPVPSESGETPIISFHKALSQSRKHTLNTTINPSLSFSIDPLRLLRLVKWQLKHPNFRLHHHLEAFIKAPSTSWLTLFREAMDLDKGMAGRFRQALLQLLQRFTLKSLSQNEVFISLFSDLSQLDRNLVKEECDFVSELTHQKTKPEFLFLYLVFDLFLTSRHIQEDKPFPLKDLIHLLPIDKDYFNVFIASQTGQDKEGEVYDPMYFKLLERHGFNNERTFTP